MRRVSRLAVVVLVLLAPIVGVLVVDPGSEVAGQATLSAENASGTQEFDSTTFDVTVYENGTARFAVIYERRLANETEEEQFKTFAKRFENESTDLYSNFQTRANALVSTGENATGRAMSASGFQRDARIRESFNTLGVVEMSFVWTGFAPVRDDGSVVVGDVFEGGIYLGPSQTFVVRHGPALRFDSVDPEGSPSGDTLQTSDSVSWAGEREFTDNRPRAVLAPADGAPTGTEPGGTTGDGTGTTVVGGEGDGLGMIPMIAIGLVALLLIALAYREFGGGVVTGEDGTGAAGSTASSGGGAGTGSAGASAGAGGAAGGAGGSDLEPAVSDEELLTDEDRVMALLEENGGRMRQVNIVEETGWSKSKVSMLLSDMEEEGSITKLRVGRENIVSLHGHEPDVAGSPFDDDSDGGNA